MSLPPDYPFNYVIVVDEYGDEVHDHPVTGMQVSWTAPSDVAINAAQLMAGKIIVCESEPEQLWSDCDFRDIDYGGPYVNHYRCKPSQHSRDISADNARSIPQNHKAVLLADGRQILVMCCNDCSAPIFYCDRSGWYHHLGWDVNPCFMHNEASWDLGTAGFQCAEYGDKPEPNEHTAWVRGHEGHIHQCGCAVDLTRCEQLTRCGHCNAIIEHRQTGVRTWKWLSSSRADSWHCGSDPSYPTRAHAPAQQTALQVRTTVTVARHETNR